MTDDPIERLNNLLGSYFNVIDILNDIEENLKINSELSLPHDVATILSKSIKATDNNEIRFWLKKLEDLKDEKDSQNRLLHRLGDMLQKVHVNRNYPHHRDCSHIRLSNV